MSPHNLSKFVDEDLNRVVKAILINLLLFITIVFYYFVPVFWREWHFVILPFLK